MDNQAELKTCPFCGGEAEIHICMVVDENNIGIIRQGQTGVHCTNCRTATHIFDNEDEAIEAWNRRVENG